MDDLISRQAAIKAVRKLYINEPKINNDYAYNMGIDQADDAIRELPSAERRGRWEDGKRIGFDGTYNWFRQCSECLYEREDDNYEKDTNYCPNCGCCMDLEGDEDE